ncbi:hypothetical protein COLO4_36576 [Corchorus olitorius]|uniref:Uncharacterized protein n=1 Tax=Corchorus olitorius TaxID=93759 RepID=A0A1R3G7T5_9ROSI|nr:hypothetical protein COLO4_36576 [Corchorus olitorius]
MMGELYLSSALGKETYVNVEIPEIAEFKMKMRQAADEASVELLGEMENSQNQLVDQVLWVGAFVHIFLGAIGQTSDVFFVVVWRAGQVWVLKESLLVAHLLLPFVWRVLLFGILLPCGCLHLQLVLVWLLASILLPPLKGMHPSKSVKVVNYNPPAEAGRNELVSSDSLIDVPVSGCTRATVTLGGYPDGYPVVPPALCHSVGSCSDRGC